MIDMNILNKISRFLSNAKCLIINLISKITGHDTHVIQDESDNSDNDSNIQVTNDDESEHDDACPETDEYIDEFLTHVNIERSVSGASSYNKSDIRDNPVSEFFTTYEHDGKQYGIPDLSRMSHDNMYTNRFHRYDSLRREALLRPRDIPEHSKLGICLMFYEPKDVCELYTFGNDSDGHLTYTLKCDEMYRSWVLRKSVLHEFICQSINEALSIMEKYAVKIEYVLSSYILPPFQRVGKLNEVGCIAG